MPKRAYVKKTFTPAVLAVIEKANEIIEAYNRQGYKLTLRQLYYQFVSRDILANKQTEYNRLGKIINNGRLAGAIDWDAIEDRTRNLQGLAHWRNPADIINSARWGYRLSRWDTQPNYVEVWIEKEALAGVFQRVCNEWDVPFFSCRGYTSQSEMWSAAERLRHYARQGKRPMILHFGDHDPSGIDMTRDIRERMALFGANIRLDRLALNFDQIEEYSPPPNPAKESDSRFDGYLREYGDSSWELDALEPSVLSGLVVDALGEVIDRDAWDRVERKEREGRDLLETVADRWEEVVEFLED